MHSLLAVLAAVLVTGAAAFTLPSDLQDGVYRAYYDKDGHEVHVLVQAAETGNVTLRRGTTDSEEPSLAKRLPGTPLLEYSCGCGFALDHTNCDNAVTGLRVYLEQHGDSSLPNNCFDLVPSTVVYSYNNNVVAFVCNGGTEYGVCSSDVANSLAAVTSHCGLYIAGTEAAAAWSPSPDGSVDVLDYYYTGYMQYTAGLDFCANEWDEGDNEHC